MVSLTCFNRCFTFNWKMAILTGLAFIFFVRLGFWQLHRADEKKQMLSAQATFANTAPVFWNPTMTMPAQYQRIALKGRFLAENILLDNQHYQHEFGYNVLTPLQLSSGKIVLVDRGWVSGDITRQKFPEPDITDEALSLTGSAYYPSEKSWILGPAFEKKQPHVTLIENIDTKLVSQLLHKPVYPFIIRLDKEMTQGYIREWPVVTMPPERHQAYALQWFAMACVVLILFIALNLKKMNENGKA
ncbi:SURF1 family protein [Legionella cardiaca]|uniref:SURF1-like protein n=1 Tax=Legionella cardiaca TaxID=1071983 RepID=A0ABY8AVA4_9GAMM|nr:SURF1 family protein [Legionella cardiaca]WED44625.1 SURF1 family protein [Legionella cardiaca]